MEIFIDIISVGEIKIELWACGRNRYSVIFSVTDKDDRRILKSSVMDNGKIKTYSSTAEGIADTMKKLMPHAKKS